MGYGERGVYGVGVRKGVIPWPTVVSLRGLRPTRTLGCVVGGGHVGSDQDGAGGDGERRHRGKVDSLYE